MPPLIESGFARQAFMRLTGARLARPSPARTEYKINFLAPAIGEQIEARGRVLRAGRSLVVDQSEVYARREGRQTLCAVALVTLTPFA